MAVYNIASIKDFGNVVSLPPITAHRPYPHPCDYLDSLKQTPPSHLNGRSSPSHKTWQGNQIVRYQGQHIAMARAVFTSGFGAHLPDSKREPLLQSQLRRLRPTPFSHLLLSQISHKQLPSPSYSSYTPVLALFKSKAKAPPKKVEKTKFKVEDGIFGTSGGIGFTKQNELFVGRVAMIGFAASLLGEAITGKGILAQLNLETGIPIYEAEPLLLFFILFTLLGAIGALGDRGRFVDDPPTGLDKAVIPPGKGIRSALGLKEGGPLFGFTKSNELFVGRLAQLGIAFSIIGEIITGKGALAQLNIETGVPISDIEPLVLFNVIFFFFAALNPGTGKFLTDVDEED